MDEMRTKALSEQLALRYGALLTTDHLAELFGISTAAVRGRKLPMPLRSSRNLYWTAEAIARFLIQGGSQKALETGATRTRRRFRANGRLVRVERVPE